MVQMSLLLHGEELLLLGTSVPCGKDLKKVCRKHLSLRFLVHLPKSVAERNHDWFIVSAGERHLEVTTVLDVTAELSELIGYDMHRISPHVRYDYPHVTTADCRIVRFEKLTGD